MESGGGGEGMGWVLMGLSTAWGLGPPVSAPPVMLVEVATQAVAEAGCADLARFAQAQVALSVEERRGGAEGLDVKVLDPGDLSGQGLRCVRAAIRRAVPAYPAAGVSVTAWIPVGDPRHLLRAPQDLAAAWLQAMERGEAGRLQAALPEGAAVDPLTACVALAAGEGTTLALQAWLEETRQGGDVPYISSPPRRVHPVAEGLWLVEYLPLLGDPARLCPEMPGPGGPETPR